MKKVELTTSEVCVITDVLNAVESCLEYDDIADEYNDNGGFIIRLDPEEKKALTRATKKI